MEQKEVTLQELRDMYTKDPTKIYVVDLKDWGSEKERSDAKDTRDC